MTDRHRAVLVLTNTNDPTADTVLRILAERRVPVVRTDPGADLHKGTSLTATYQQGGRRGAWQTPTRHLDLTQVRSVWQRRPSRYRGQDGLSEQDELFAGSEAFWGVGGILATLPGAHYVNNPWDNRAAEYKPAQLAAAQDLGMAVPATLITNDPAAAREFCADQKQGAVYKPLFSTPYRSTDGEPQQVWVREVRPEEITDAVSACPHQFQEKIDKAYDVRLTVVGEHQFAVRIDGPDLDWRRRQNLLDYQLIPVPEDVAAAVDAYRTRMRLVFGAFDFAVTADGTWYFLECNPNGQWAWFPPTITDSIAHAIADTLEKGAP